MIPKHTQAGAALLSVLLIVATLAVAATIALESVARQTEIQKLTSRRMIARWAERSAEAAVLSATGDLVAASRAPANDPQAERAISYTLPTEGGQIVLRITELAPCINLNALGNPDQMVAEQHTFALTSLLTDAGVPIGEAHAMAAGAADWIDSDALPRPSGGEAPAYLSREAGFRAADQPMLSAAELAVIPGFSAEARTFLQARTCALPDTGPAVINVNALSPEDALVIRALTLGQVSENDIVRLASARPSAGWASVGDFQTQLAARPDLAVLLSQLKFSTSGRYFLAEGAAQLDTGSQRFRFLLDAEAPGGAGIVWRSLGGAG